MMVDDKFSIWDLKHPMPEDDDFEKTWHLRRSFGAGAADPKAIDFQWHQRNFEDALDSLDKNNKPSVDGVEGRRAVELICSIYESINQDGAKIFL